MQNNFCPLTGYPMSKDESKIYPQIDTTFIYEFLPVGKVIIALPTYQIFIANRQQKHPILAGICREAFETNIEPPIINSDFIENQLKNRNYPKLFTEKAFHLLMHIYSKGGNDYKEFRFLGTKDYPLAYAENQIEFNKIIHHLEDKFFIKIGHKLQMSGHKIIFEDVTLTDFGIAEVEKDLPKIPMIGLVNQEISTGNLENDETINHAKKMFFEHPQSIDNMRSACESLSYILEPLRKDCEVLFTKSDTNVFFKIINDFDIRHNKNTTRQIEFPEQLEWIFYSLLNTINAYTKLKQKLEL